MVFPVAIYGCENWTIKKAECQRIDAFELEIRRAGKPGVLQSMGRKQSDTTEPLNNNNLPN